jgi:hypothetical protein
MAGAVFSKIKAEIAKATQRGDQEAVESLKQKLAQAQKFYQLHGGNALLDWIKRQQQGRGGRSGSITFTPEQRAAAAAMPKTPFQLMLQQRQDEGMAKAKAALGRGGMAPRHPTEQVPPPYALGHPVGHGMEGEGFFSNLAKKAVAAAPSVLSTAKQLAPVALDAYKAYSAATKKSPTGKGRKGARAPSERNKLVSKMMKENPGMKLGEASKRVSAMMKGGAL